jgi:hypothetical protein
MTNAVSRSIPPQRLINAIRRVRAPLRSRPQPPRPTCKTSDGVLPETTAVASRRGRRRDGRKGERQQGNDSGEQVC